MENKTIKIDEIERLLFDTEISGYRIAKDSGMSSTQVLRLRNKERELKNISIDLALRLQNYINELKKENKF